MFLFITIGIILLGIFLFIKEYFSIDTTSLLIMTLFIVTGVLSPEEGFSGFIHPATATLGCMFVISAAIFKTGIIDGLSSRIIKLAKIHYVIALLVFCVVTAVFSAFMNDTAVVAIMIPMALLVCKETDINPSKLLIPISFAACFGGACTIIGTGTNILISGYAQQSGLEAFGMFEFSVPAMILAGIGLLYVFFIAPFLLPKREGNGKEKSLGKEAEKYTTELKLLAECSDIKKQISQSKIVKDYRAQVLLVMRGDHQIQDFTSDFLLKEGDILKILITPEKLIDLKHARGYQLIGDEASATLTKIGQENNNSDMVPEEEQKRVYEVLIPMGSQLAGQSLKQLNFKDVYRASVLAVRHRSETILQDLNDVMIKEGDMLLIFTTEKDISKLKSERLAIVISNYERKQVDVKKAIAALLIAAGVVTAAALNIASILMCGMVGSLLLVTTSILKPHEAYQAIDWKVIFMMAGVLSMGMALEKTGGSEIISVAIFNSMGDLDPRITLSLVFLVTFLSTNIFSSRASAALMAPIVISLAAVLGVSERPFLVAVMFACAFTFMTPVCNPTNTMVYAPGNYRYNDYLKVGTPLNIIIWIAASFIIPLFFPF